MEDLNETYAKFLHQNAMTAEDVRGEAMRSKEKYENAMAEIMRLNAYIEEKRILNLKIQTTFRKRCENLEMQVQDFEQERLRLENEVEIMEARLEMKQEEMDDLAHDLYRIQDVKKSKGVKHQNEQTNLAICGTTL